MSGSDACLQLDVGNGSTKWRLVAAGTILARGTYREDEPATERELLGAAPEPARIWVASVAAPGREAALRALLASRWNLEPWFARSVSAACGLRNSYAEPERLGVDRWLAMLGARERVAGRLCVVDAGSALTLDVVAADGRHEGGYIIPGSALMERALLLDTGRVRFAEDAGYSLAPGTSTAEAVRHGISVAQVGALRTVLAEVGDLNPVFCGGGAEPLMALSGVDGLLAPDLVFEGLEVMAAALGEAD